MTNAEFYKEKIRDYILAGNNICDELIKPVVFNNDIDCAKTNCASCRLFVSMWAQEEHKEPEIDWGSMPIDTPVLVRDCEDDPWKRRYFAGVSETGDVMAWYGGHSSFTGRDCTSWTYAELWEGSVEQKAELELEEGQ